MGDLASLRWRPQQVLQKRWATSPSSTSSGSSSSHQHNKFRSGTVDSIPYQVKPNFSVPVWRPPARFMKYRAVRWLSHNLLALATYQLALEAVFTIVFGSLLYAEAITAEGVRDWLTRLHYPFASWFDVEDGIYTEPVRLGPFTLNPHKMTALHTGHNIANALLPLQVVLMLSTFSPMQGLYRSLRGLPQATAANAATAGSSAKTAGNAGGSSSSSTASAATRRASYARPSTRDSSPRQPF